MKMSILNEELLLAADSGGSKTDWRYLNCRGETVKKITTPGMAALHAGTLPVKQYAQIAYDAMSECKVKRIYFSLGGPNVEEVKACLQTVWRDSIISVEREASGDLAASCMDFLQCNAVVMGGTGVTAMGFNADNSRNFAEGWGPVFGDHGSGGGIGMQAVQIFLQGVDKTADAGKLNGLFAAQLDGLDLKKFADRMELKRRINELSRKDLAALAPQVMSLAESGNPAAAKIITQSAQYMAKLAAAVAPDGGGNVLMLGGLFKLGAAYRQQCIEELQSLRSDCRWQYNEFCNIGAMAAAKVLMLEDIKVDKNIWNKIITD